MDNAGVVGGNEVFRDRETGSRWQQSSLQAISGPLKGEHLELYQFLLTDKETGSRWDAYGKCLSGPLKGSQLESLILEPEYWFAWSEFHSETKIYSPAARKN